MNIYHDWGFKDNPFKTTSLPAKEEGEKLIAGRDQKIRKFIRRLYNQPQIVTMEGLNGIGKSSIINVSIFRAFTNYLRNRSENPLFVPCTKVFQLKPESSAEDFMDEVFIEIAQTLIRYKRELIALNVKLPENLDEIDTWLNSPQLKSYQGSLGIATFNVGMGQNIKTNVSKGFEKSGFRIAVRNWLMHMFPKENFGGIVCVIDNMELLERSATARKVIEELRDSLFNVQGIRWVMCGALGIISSIVASPRLEGMLHDPILVNGILKKFAPEILEKRVNAFKKGDYYYLPLTLESFSELFDILQLNIRNTLKYANDFCIWVDDMELKPQSTSEKESVFLKWIVEKSNRYYQDIQRQLKPRTLQLFKDAIELKDGFALADHDLFDYESPQAMRPCIKNLESRGLIISVIDEQDSRRKSIQITPKGWFVSHAMKH